MVSAEQNHRAITQLKEKKQLLLIEKATGA